MSPALSLYLLKGLVFRLPRAPSRSNLRGLLLQLGGGRGAAGASGRRGAGGGGRRTGAEEEEGGATRIVLPAACSRQRAIKQRLRAVCAPCTCRRPALSLPRCRASPPHACHAMPSCRSCRAPSSCIPRAVGQRRRPRRPEGRAGGAGGAAAASDGDRRAAGPGRRRPTGAVSPRSGGRPRDVLKGGPAGSACVHILAHCKREQSVSLLLPRACPRQSRRRRRRRPPPLRRH